ncbi:MAG: hypothetical protein H0V53_07215 [Rubrobacter sp.]|nr:hypothetical protein [Rubrobacter sp.]
MGFEDSALGRLRRYREDADRSLAVAKEAGEAAGRLFGRLAAGLDHAAGLGRQAGFETEAMTDKGIFTLRAAAGPGAEARLTLGLLRGAAAETDEDLMHEDLSRWSLAPSGYSGRILGWSDVVGEDACQTFAVYGDGLWKTRGVFVEKARGRVGDPEEVLNGFCLRMLGRLVDLAALTGGAGRRWSAGASYTLPDLMDGRDFPTELRLPR